MRPFILLVLLPLKVYLFGCNSESKPASAVALHPSDPPELSALEVDPRLQEADSIIWVVYEHPFSKDSLSYTRYYHQQSITDSSFLHLMREQLQQKVAVREGPMPCRNEGKIWLFSRGRIFQTLYFAFSKADCSFLFYIKDGLFYFLELKSPFRELLIRSIARIRQ
jgi:hypothetical protein